MEGQFLTWKRERSNIWLMLWLAVFAVAYAARKPLLLVCAALAIAVVLLMITFNRRGYFRIEQGRIHARYHWFARLDCSLDEVAFANAQSLNLNILMKNGKGHTIAFLENAHELSNEIQRQISTREQESPHALKNQLAQVQLKRRRGIYRVIACCVILFWNILLTVWMTGGRELSEFSRRDWVLFSIMAAIEIGTLVWTFAIACRSGHQLVELAYLCHRIQGAAIMTQILPSACVKAVYTDPEFNGRLVVCGIPNEGSLYYIVQEFDDDFHLTTTETSRFFDNDSDLMEDLSADLIDITGWFS